MLPLQWRLLLLGSGPVTQPHDGLGARALRFPEMEMPVFHPILRSPEQFPS